MIVVMIDGDGSDLIFTVGIRDRDSDNFSSDSIFDIHLDYLIFKVVIVFAECVGWALVSFSGVIWKWLILNSIRWIVLRGREVIVGEIS